MKKKIIKVKGFVLLGTISGEISVHLFEVDAKKERDRYYDLENKIVPCEIIYKINLPKKK